LFSSHNFLISDRSDHRRSTRTSVGDRLSRLSAGGRSHSRNRSTDRSNYRHSRESSPESAKQKKELENYKKSLKLANYDVDRLRAERDHLREDLRKEKEATQSWFQQADKEKAALEAKLEVENKRVKGLAKELCAVVWKFVGEETAEGEKSHAFPQPQASESVEVDEEVPPGYEENGEPLEFQLTDAT
jgi:hypothetical protein